MSTVRNVKESLAKKLSGKKVPKKPEQNFVAERNSPFFQNKEIIEKTNKAKAKSNSNLETRAINSELQDSSQGVAVKRKANKFKINRKEETKSTLEVITQSLETKKSGSENKLKLLNEEACCSKKIKRETLEKKWEPVNWKLMLDNIRKMRSNVKAPVDTMGCHKCADMNADEKTQRYQKLVALMLSSQTKDEVTFRAMLRLRENNLTPEVISNMKINVLENILHPVSFYKNKAKYLQQTSKILIEKYNSDIPNNIKELVLLPGVGPKMAHLCMSTAWKEVTGIGVDVHVHRISNRMGWLQKPSKEPEQTRVGLETWLPQHLWSEVNYLLVGFGQTVCLPVKPKCSECLNCEICPFNEKVVKKTKNQKISK